MKIPTVPFILCLVLILVFSPIFAQSDAETIEPVFAPFPDKIRVGSRNNEVIISWEDTIDAQFGYRIYRSKELPSQENYVQAELLGESQPGKQFFSYRVSEETAYYYFILAKTEADLVYEIFIPLRNVTLLPVQIVLDTPISRPSIIVGTINHLRAEQAGEMVRISFQPSADAGRAVLYRATAPILSAVNLLESIIIAVLEEGRNDYQDYPIPGIPYFYAVIPESQLKAGSTIFTAGKNSTEHAVIIPAGLYRVGLPTANPISRSIPLPLLVFDRSIRSDLPLSTLNQVPLTKVSSDTEKAIHDLVVLVGRTRTITQPPQTLPKTTVQSGEQVLLSEIITRDFLAGNYNTAIKNLGLFLSLPRSTAVAAQARFYRGQSYVMLGLWREAFFEFLQSQTEYYRESKLWIDYLLDVLQSL
jgi:hypothetical protein